MSEKLSIKDIAKKLKDRHPAQEEEKSQSKEELTKPEDKMQSLNEKKAQEVEGGKEANLKSETNQKNEDVSPNIRSSGKPKKETSSIKELPDTNSNKEEQGLDEFLKFMKGINDIDKYDGKGVVYIDTDIHDICQMLKKNAKIKISNLVSYLLEEFIKNNQDAITMIMEQKRKNKYFQ